MRISNCILIICLLFVGCKKDPSGSGLVGHWIWFQSTGGIGNIKQTPANSGASWHLQLKADSTSYQFGTIPPNGTGIFTTAVETDVNRIDIKTGSMNKSYNYYLLPNNILQLDERDISDGLSFYFVSE